MATKVIQKERKPYITERERKYKKIFSAVLWILNASALPAAAVIKKAMKMWIEDSRVFPLSGKYSKIYIKSIFEKVLTSQIMRKVDI